MFNLKNALESEKTKMFFINNNLSDNYVNNTILLWLVFESLT